MDIESLEYDGSYTGGRPPCPRCHVAMTSAVRVPQCRPRWPAAPPVSRRLPVWRCLQCRIESPRLD